MSAGAMALTTAADTLALGGALGRALRAGDVVALSGPLGAGKTVLARGALAALGLRGEAPSPSFALVIPYEPPEVLLALWHVDLYRLDRPDELDQLGLEDARLDAALLVEWPERAGASAWPDALRLTLRAEAGDSRRLTWEAPASWEPRWPPARS